MSTDSAIVRFDAPDDRLDRDDIGGVVVIVVCGDQRATVFDAHVDEPHTSTTVQVKIFSALRAGGTGR